MQTVILAGGLGTRLVGDADVRPKPMVTVGGQPLLWHIMSSYAAQGFDDFVLALGHLADAVRDYVIRLAVGGHSFRANLKTGEIDRLDTADVSWRVTATDTGPTTHSGGRLKRAARYVDDGVFMATYGDGLADLDLRELVEFHRGHGRLVTLTAVRAPTQYGHLHLDGPHVREFREKRPFAETWINGGFFVVDKRALAYVDDDATDWEGDALTRLARDGQLMAFRHDGFWHSMDTQRDRTLLEDLWNTGRTPWRRR